MDVQKFQAQQTFTTIILKYSGIKRQGINQKTIFAQLKSKILI